MVTLQEPTAPGWRIVFASPCLIMRIVGFAKANLPKGSWLPHFYLVFPKLKSRYRSQGVKEWTEC